MFAHGLRSASRVSKQPVRRMGGLHLNKNVYAEENAGLREKSYETWEFNLQTLGSLTCFLLIPGYIIYNLAKNEAVIIFYF